MSSLFIKAIKITVLGLMPLFLVSNTSTDYPLEDVDLLEGVYILRASGNLNQELRGTVRFKTDTQTSLNGEVFSLLELELDNSWGNIVHSMGFLVAERNQSHKISVGTYKISNHIDGFLSDFEGVFGFANIDSLGELPFFAQKGKIKIEHIDNQTIEGNIAIVLQNAREQMIEVEGDFKAIKRLE